ncbi:unnamed protein product [Discosporangium mesarthrocarpum]
MMDGGRIRLDRLGKGAWEAAATTSSLRCAQIVGSFILAVLLLEILWNGSSWDTTAQFESRSSKVDEGKGMDLAREGQSTNKRILNLIFVKPHQVGGSTMGGIVRRIMSRHGGSPEEYNSRVTKHRFFAKRWNAKRLNFNPAVKAHMWANHDDCQHLVNHANLEVFHKAFKFTITREPVDRCLSQFYYVKSSGVVEAMQEAGILPGMEYHPDPLGNDPVTEAKIKFVPKCMGKSVYHYIRCSQEQSMQEVLDLYQFIGVTERWLDTVTVLKMKLDLDYGDILHLSSKVNNGEPSPAGGKVTAYGVKRPPMFEEPRAVIDAINAYPETAADKEFWNMANAKMDQHIEELKPRGFVEVRARIESLLKELKEVCMEEAIHPQYTKEEQEAWLRDREFEKYNLLFYMDCYWYDNGCGVTCMDKFAEARGLNGTDN